MKKCAVFSGFPGSGKTSTMMALTRYYSAHCGKAAMISNDLGEGVTLAGIVDEKAREVSDRYPLERLIFKRDHVGLGE